MYYRIFLLLPSVESLPSRFPYASLFQYSPRGKTPVSLNSQKLVGLIKRGDSSFINTALTLYEDTISDNFTDFLHQDALLIPIPRSAPLVADALWPSRVIAEALVDQGYGKESLACIERKTSVPKSSSSYSAGTRPSVKVHAKSLVVHPQVLSSQQITLIDDVVTLGRTSLVCAVLLSRV